MNSSSLTQDSVVGTGGRYTDYSWWINDVFKVSTHLTLTLGLRDDIWLPYKEVLDRESFFNPTQPNSAAGGRPGILEFYGNGPDSCHCETNVETDWHNLGPRLGAAYSFGKNSDWVVRAGYTIMYTHRGAVGGRVGARIGTGLVGFSATPSFTSPTGNNFDPAYFWDNGIPAYQQPPFFSPTYGTEFNGISTTGATMQWGDPSLGGVPPRYQNWNVSVDHAFTSTLTLGAAYIGSNGHFLGEATNGGGRGIWSDQINPVYLALGNLLNAPANAANIAAANAIVPGIGLPFSGFTGSIAQMLRPFPQYPGISDLWGDIGNSHYNSVQVTAVKTTSHGLTFNFNYTFARGIDDTAGSRSAYNWVTERSRTQIPEHVLNLLFVYAIPIGRGKQFGNKNKVVDAVAGGWQVSGITTYRSGAPIGTIGAACNLPDAGSCYANYSPGFSGPVRINGGWGSGNVLGANAATYLDIHAFSSPAAYTYGNTPRTAVFGIYLPGSFDQDLSLRRSFPITEKVHFDLEGDAINVFNFVNFASPNTSVNSSAFGKISGQAGTPRVLQLSARIAF